MIEIWVIGIATVPMPRTAAMTTADFPGFPVNAAFGTRRDGRRSRCSSSSSTRSSSRINHSSGRSNRSKSGSSNRSSGCTSNGSNSCSSNRSSRYSGNRSRGNICASVEALRPRVDEVFFAGPSTGTDPRTTGEAAVRHDFIAYHVAAALATGSRSRSSGRRWLASFDAF